MGESKLKQKLQDETLMTCTGVQTVAGRVQVRWESKSASTPMGQLVYFIEFINLTGLWQRWLESCPLTYLSHNSPSKADVLGTWMLSVLSGHKRYSHVTAIRCDGINPSLLEMNKVISEDSMRNALKRIPETEGTAWLDQHITDSTAQLLDAPWIMDTDTTVNTLWETRRCCDLLQPDETGAPFTHLSQLHYGRTAPRTGCRGSRWQRACRKAYTTRTVKDARWLVYIPQT
jgi:hypothetical protein